MSRETRPHAGEVFLDSTGAPCLIVKTWPWEDRASVLSHGHVELVELNKLTELDFDSILSANEVNDGKDRSTSSGGEEPGRGSTEP